MSSAAVHPPNGGTTRPGACWWLITIFVLFLGSLCYVMASFYHLTMGERWSFGRAYALALLFVSIEYMFNVYGNRRAAEHLTVVQTMVMIFVVDFVALFLVNGLFLHNPVSVWRDGLSILLLFAALLVSVRDHA